MTRVGTGLSDCYPSRYVPVHNTYGEAIRATFLIAYQMSTAPDLKLTVPDDQGRFGPYGGRYVSETLMAPLEELSRAYHKIGGSRRFKKRFGELLRHWSRAQDGATTDAARASPVDASIPNVSIIRVCIA